MRRSDGQLKQNAGTMGYCKLATLAPAVIATHLGGFLSVRVWYSSFHPTSNGMTT